MSFVDELSTLPSAANGLTREHYDALSRLHAAGDRGGFYLAYMTMLSQMRPTSNTDQAAIDRAIFQVQMQAHISTYSGFIGGAALLGNAVAKFGNPDKYNLALDTFSNDIVLGLLEAIDSSIRSPATGTDRPESGRANDIPGFVGQDAIQRADQGTWQSKELGDYFPGNFQLWNEDYQNLLTAGTIGAGLAGLQLVLGKQVGFEATDYAGAERNWLGVNYKLLDDGKVAWVNKPGIESQFKYLTEVDPFWVAAEVLLNRYAAAGVLAAGSAVVYFNDALRAFAAKAVAEFWEGAKDGFFSLPRNDSELRDKLTEYVGAHGEDFSPDHPLPNLVWHDFPLVMRNEGTFQDDENGHVLLAFASAEIDGGQGGDFGIAFRQAVLRGGDDNDILVGSDQTRIFGDRGSDAILVRDQAAADGGADDDYIIAIGKDTEAKGGSGNDLLMGFKANTLDGGTGNDWVIALGGDKVVTIGGNGQDWLFNTSSGGKIYADTVDGRSEDGTDLDAKENADNIWWWSDVTLMDARHNDVLKFFGIPLTGGKQGIPLMVSGAAGIIGAGFSDRAAAGIPLYFDNLLPFIEYVMKGKDLKVVNSFSQLGDLFTWMYPGTPEKQSGIMTVKDFDFQHSAWGGELFVRSIRGDTGDLGMLFKDANALLGAVALFVPGFGTLAAMIDEAFDFLASAIRLIKILKWASATDPLVLDLDGDGLETVAIEDQALYFDVDGDFFAERTGWLKGDDGFLTLDLNRNGQIDDISEMFGSVRDTGFADLAVLDTNKDGAITTADRDFGRLTVWQDKDQDGLTDQGELKSLTELGITRIDLAGAKTINVTTPQGTELRAESSFTRADGSKGAVLEAVFELDDIDTVYRGEKGLAPWMRAAPCSMFRQVCG